MNRKDAMTWVLSICAPCLRLSQAKTLSELVEAAMRCPRISLPNIGRASGGGVASPGLFKDLRRIAGVEVVSVVFADG